MYIHSLCHIYILCFIHILYLIQISYYIYIPKFLIIVSYSVSPRKSLIKKNETLPEKKSYTLLIVFLSYLILDEQNFAEIYSYIQG